MFESTFTLTQHTPLLHFLHDQPGATLRATELKPKLDKFIINTFINWPENTDGLFDAAIGKIRSSVESGDPSPYRVFIHTNGAIPRYYYYESFIKKGERDQLPEQLKRQFNLPNLEVIYPSSFFANADKRSHQKWDEIKLGVLYETPIEVRVSSWDESIIQLIKKALPLLFCIENFGTRQSKGFGCFSIPGLSSAEFERIAARHFVYVAKKPLPGDQLGISRAIDGVYKDIRSRPDPDGFEPVSFIRDYFRGKTPEVEWEKETVVRVLIHEDGKTADDDVRFVRAVLGLPGLYDYPQAQGKPKVNIRDKEKKIERYRSPILFKIHGNALYLLASDVDTRMLGERAFLFFKGDEPNESVQTLELKTPVSFDIKDFFNNQNLRGWTTISTYLAITIGPIYQTIQRAKKTRELWAASFVLSQFMRAILTRLEDAKYGIALSPDVDALKDAAKHHGAGIWNDNCFYLVHAERVEALKAKLPELLRAAKAEALASVPLDHEPGRRKLPLSAAQLSELFDRHFYCSAILHSRTPDQAGQEKVLIELGKQLAATETLYLGPEQYDDCVAEALFLPETVKNLYKTGFDPGDDRVFTFVSDTVGRRFRRMPSLLEIATREFRKPVFSVKYKALEAAISKQIGPQDADAQSASDIETAELELERIAGTPDDDSTILHILKGIQTADGKPVFKKRHKYVAVVQSDGDGIGRIIRDIPDTDVKRMTDFSSQLMAFSKAAVDEVADYGGLPVYAGGDDLLFIAPLQNAGDKNLFDLLATLQRHFAAQPMLAAANATISFGVSIFYYKFPMGEAIDEGRKQLFRIAKKLRFSPAGAETGRPAVQEKNALAFRVLLHGGQAFGAVLQQQGAVWSTWTDLLHQQAQADTAFLSGLVHKLEQLEFLLEDACAHQAAGFFFERHFNEARGAQRDFVQAVCRLAEAIYREYAALHIEAEDQLDFFEGQLAMEAGARQHWPPAATLQSRYRNNLLYSALRLIQFLNAEDHD